MTTLEELNFYSLMSGQNLDILKLKQVRREIRLFMSIVGGGCLIFNDFSSVTVRISEF